ncbi:hypothetical protein Agub_g4414, partial [Astrephomene gubernaculifera]
MTVRILTMGRHPWVVGLCLALHVAISSAMDTLAYHELPNAVATRTKDAYDQLRELSDRESFIQSLFGRDCYSQALLQVNRDCNSMTTEQQYKLAHAMNICFLTANGHAGYSCSPRMSHRECSGQLDDRAFASYNTFFTNIHT